MPAVDVRCINQNHTISNGPKYYQIKTTEKNKYHNGYKYFSLAERYICTGSLRFGYNCHVMTYDDEYKDILIGYICLEYIYINQDTIRVDSTTSFILIPNLLYQPTNIEEASATYYSYITNPLVKPIITFNSLMCNILKFNNDFDISLNLNFDAKKIKIRNEEPPGTLDFKSKYLIMKMKYLNLKNKLNNINIL